MTRARRISRLLNLIFAALLVWFVPGGGAPAAWWRLPQTRAMPKPDAGPTRRSEERRVGKECRL